MVQHARAYMKHESQPRLYFSIHTHPLGSNPEGRPILGVCSFTSFIIFDYTLHILRAEKRKENSQDTYNRDSIKM